MFFARGTIPFPADLGDALERALAARLRGRRPGDALRALWPKLAKERGRAGEDEKHYSFHRDEAEAYAAYYLPANCLKTALVLEEAFLLGLDPVPGDARWLDFGTGPGTAFWGAAWWCAHRGRKLQFTGWDQSPQFLSIARDLAAGSPFGARTEFTQGDDPVTLVRKLRPTHVSFVNSVAEIFSDEERRKTEIGKIARVLADLEQKDGHRRYLLLIEPGSRDSSRELAALKDVLRGEMRTLLPCLDDRACGALADPRDWCHEEVACDFPEWLNAIGAEAGLRKESLLFSYAFSRPGQSAEAPLADCARMVSQRMERKGQVECRLCTPRGKRAARVQRSKATPENAFVLEAARGDLWRNAEIGEKGDVERAEKLEGREGSIF